MAVNYTGPIHVLSTDPRALLPPASSLTSGVGTFMATMTTSGDQILTSADVTTSSIFGTSSPITVTSTATHFAVSSGPSTGTAGGGFAILVTAEDQFNHIVPGYTGTIHLSSTDAHAVLSANTTLTNGFAAFAVNLTTAGLQTVTAVDTANNSINGQTVVTVVPGAPARFTVLSATLPSGFSPTGSPLGFTVTARDLFGNVATGYAGTVHFQSSDGTAVLPPDATLTAGVGVFNVNFNASGNQTVTVTDLSNPITGFSALVAVRGLVVSNFTPTPSGFIATFSKPINPLQINIYQSNITNNGPPDVTLVGPTGTVRGSLLIDPTDTTITFVKTDTVINGNFNPAGGLLVPGTYQVTLVSGATAFTQPGGPSNNLLLDGFNNGKPGGNYVATFNVIGSNAIVAGVPDFARGPDSTAPIDLPNTTSNGIPLALSSAAGVTSAVFTLQYNSALLQITGAFVNPSLGGTALILDPSSVPGTAVIDFVSPTPLTGVAVRLGGLTADVPLSAASMYGAKALLHFSKVQINGGLIPATATDALQVIGYLGDAVGDGDYSPLDATLISRVATNLDTGFAAFACLDPAIIGDISGGGTVNSTDVTLMNRIVAGIAVAQTPLIPDGLTIAPAGPDPLLSLPSSPLAVSGGTVVVPVDIDTARPTGSSGMMEAVLALRYDTSAFSVSAADVQLGSVPSAGSDWQLSAVVDPLTGEIGIDLFSGTPIAFASGGSLITHLLPHPRYRSGGVSIYRSREPGRSVRCPHIPHPGGGRAGSFCAAHGACWPVANRKCAGRGNQLAGDWSRPGFALWQRDPSTGRRTPSSTFRSLLLGPGHQRLFERHTRLVLECEPRRVAAGGFPKHSAAQCFPWLARMLRTTARYACPRPNQSTVKAPATCLMIRICKFNRGWTRESPWPAPVSLGCNGATKPRGKSSTC